MKRSVYLLLMGIGILSIISGLYLLLTGAEFEQYFSGIFIGIALIGITYINNKQKLQDS